jgi:hypothetical protein
MTAPTANLIEELKPHLCQHGKDETVHRTVRIDELRAAVEAMVCCSRQGKSGRHDPGCWSGCKNAVLALVGDSGV